MHIYIARHEQVAVNLLFIDHFSDCFDVGQLEFGQLGGSLQAMALDDEGDKAVYVWSNMAAYIPLFK